MMRRNRRRQENRSIWWHDFLQMILLASKKLQQAFTARCQFPFAILITKNCLFRLQCGVSCSCFYGTYLNILQSWVMVWCWTVHWRARGGCEKLLWWHRITQAGWSTNLLSILRSKVMKHREVWGCERTVSQDQLCHNYSFSYWVCFVWNWALDWVVDTGVDMLPGCWFWVTRTFTCWWPHPYWFHAHSGFTNALFGPCGEKL